MLYMDTSGLAVYITQGDIKATMKCNVNTLDLKTNDNVNMS